MNRSSLIWPLAALALFLAGGALMRAGEKTPALERPEVAFPRFDQKSYMRAQERRTLLHQVRTKLEGKPEELTNVSRDPLLVAMSAGGSNLVIEANAILNSPLGALLMGCAKTEAKAFLDEMQQKLGVDPLQALDRVALGTEGQTFISGHFKKMDPKALFGERYVSRPIGDKGLLFERDTGGDFVGIWDQQMIITGKTEQDVRQAIDRLEGRSEPMGMMSSDLQYGEAYGNVDPRFVSKLLQDPALESRLAEVANKIELHVDTQEAVAMELRFKGDDPKRLDELARSVGSLLALARVKAKAEGNAELEQLLEFAEVNDRQSGHFNMRLALSLDFFRERLGSCADPAPKP